MSTPSVGEHCITANTLCQDEGQRAAPCRLVRVTPAQTMVVVLIKFRQEFYKVDKQRACHLGRNAFHCELVSEGGSRKVQGCVCVSVHLHTSEACAPNGSLRFCGFELQD